MNCILCSFDAFTFSGFAAGCGLLGEELFSIREKSASASTQSIGVVHRATRNKDSNAAAPRIQERDAESRANDSASACLESPCQAISSNMQAVLPPAFKMHHGKVERHWTLVSVKESARMIFTRRKPRYQKRVQTLRRNIHVPFNTRGGNSFGRASVGDSPAVNRAWRKTFYSRMRFEPQWPL